MPKTVVGAFEKLGNEGRMSRVSRSTAVSRKSMSGGASGRKTPGYSGKPTGGLGSNQGLKKLPNFG